MDVCEIVYLNRDNSMDLLLKADGTAVDLSSVPRIDLVVDWVTTISSSHRGSDAIRWARQGYAAGEVRLKLGQSEIEAGKYNGCRLAVYDPTNPNGIVWGRINLLVS